MQRRIHRNNFRGLVTVDCPACGRFAADRALVKEAVDGNRDLACPRGHLISWRHGLTQAMRHVDNLAKSSLASWNETIDSIFEMLRAHAARVETARQRLRKLRK